jgi:multicomponent Na+:H+ antiporter subunit E
MLIGNLLLALAWAVLQAEVTLANLIVGFILGYLILLMLTRGGLLGQSRYVGKVSMALGLAAYFLYELVHANVRLARDVATPKLGMNPGIVSVPLDANSNAEIFLLAALVNLTPGSVALDVSSDRKHLYVHVMYMTDPEQARAEIKNGFERRVLHLLRS